MSSSGVEAKRESGDGGGEPTMTMATGPSLEDSSPLKFYPLGAGREVGRSCHIIEFKGKTLMLDCGVHPGRKGMNGLPFFDSIDPKKVDIVLITHFHLDHVASLPYFTEKTDFEGEIYMTRPTRVVAEILLKDYVRIGSSEDEPGLFTAKELRSCLSKCRTVDYHQEIVVGGIKLIAYNAGHVLGAAMFLIEISGVRILYTGDYSREEDRHLMTAEVPSVQPDILIVESTYGTMVHKEKREEREARFTRTIEHIVRRGGRCLIPVFSLGRAQELLLILEDHWSRHKSLQGIPIYHNSKVASKALEVYRTYINFMNEDIRRKNRQSNPWHFEHIYPLHTNTESDGGPAVILASPGMLQSGHSRKLFEEMCSDERNGVILAGYSVEGTLAKTLSTEGGIKEIQSLDGHMLKLNCQVETISFAAHSDVIGTRTFVQQTKPKNIILVHGEATQMERLKNDLRRMCDNEALELGMKDTKIFNPANNTSVDLVFYDERIVKAMGVLASKRPRNEGNEESTNGHVKSRSPGTIRIAGILVRHEFTERLVAPEELASYTQLCTTAIMQQLHLPFHAPFDRLVSFVGKLFRVKILGEPEISDPSIRETKKRRGESSVSKMLRVHDAITLTHTTPPGRILMEWEASPETDMIADAITTLVMQAEGGFGTVRLGTCCSIHHLRGELEEHMDESQYDKYARGENKEHLFHEDSVKSPLDKTTTHVLVNMLNDHFGSDAVRTNPKNSTITVHQFKNNATCVLHFNETTSTIDHIESVGETKDPSLEATINTILGRLAQVSCPIPFLPSLSYNT